MNETAKKDVQVLKSTDVATVTPASLLVLAVEQNADLDKLERLMDLEERWEKAEAKKAFVVATSSFRSQCPIIDRTRKGHNGKYAGLAETLEQIKGLMGDCGLSHSWKIDQHENGLISVQCSLTHIGGHTECTSMSAAPDDTGSKNSIQALGSTVSYLERYTLFALLGMASKDMDQDGGAPQKYITAEQVANIEALIEDVGANREGFLKVCKLDDFSQMTVDKYKGAIKRLEEKR